MRPNRKRRDHTWSDPKEISKGYSLEHMDGNIYHGEFRTVAATVDDAELAGFLGFVSHLVSRGIHVPKSLRRANDDNEGGRDNQGS